nr:uncharacterized mitochondrial protein AtMg00810-like [Tanacetum cinerariifolium]
TITLKSYVEVISVGNKMHKAFLLPGESSHWQYKFPLPVEGVPTARRMEIPLPGVCTAMMKKLPSSKKQDCTSMSSAEAEYVSLSACCAQHSRTKHIDVHYHFIKEKVKKGMLGIKCTRHSHCQESSHWQYKFPLPVEGVPTARRMEIPLPGVCTAMMKKLPVKDRWQLH